MNKQNAAALSASEKILNAAKKLFYEEGIQAVGIDQIIKEANVAMNTFYKYFPSKDFLVEQYLKNKDTQWRNWFNSYIKSNATIKQNILNLFDALNEWFHEDSFRGCAFINASGEIGEVKPYILKISKQHKENIYNDILELIKKLEIKNPETVTKQITTLIEGAIVRAYINDDKNAAAYAKSTAKLILENI